VERIYDWITQPLPRQEAVQLFGKKMVPQPHLIMGDVLPHRNAVEADVPFALMWLETMARLNFLPPKRRMDEALMTGSSTIATAAVSGIPTRERIGRRPRNSWPWSTFPIDDGAAECQTPLRSRSSTNRS